MTPLTAERWKLIEAIFTEASQQEEPARSETIKRLSGHDAELCREVEKIFASYQILYGRNPLTPASAGALTGSKISHYRIDRLLGQGGMGSVYLAHRDDGQFQQSVAIKLMSPHLADEFFSDRFRRERQILADLDHPNITRLCDGGVSDHGEPYLVMEYVDGQRFDEYCDQRRLTVRERIQLFLQICSAMQYTHAKHILHRDLKPSNILVTANGFPKLLDFGTAKLLASTKSESTTTRFGMMTLRYASPEQLRGELPTAATDIYSLGVVLYESLTGAWPFGDPQSIIAGLDRAVHDVKPARMTDMITEKSAEDRSNIRPQLASPLRGGLESIATKALQSKPEDRYASMEEFAFDLQRFLDGKAVATGTRTGWLSRRSTQAALLTVVVALLCVFAYYVIQKKGASASATQSLVVLPFVNSGVDAAIGTRDQYLADGLTDDITEELARIPPLRVKIRQKAGTANPPPVKDEASDLTLRASHELRQNSPASYAQAEQYLRQAIEIDPQDARAYLLLGTIRANISIARGDQVRTQQGRDQAVAMWRKALAIAPGLGSARVALAGFAIQYDWDWAGAERELRQVLENERNASAENAYSFLLLYKRRFAEAELHRRRSEELDPISVASVSNSALFWFQAGKFERSLEAANRLGGPNQLIMQTQNFIAQGELNLAQTALQKADKRSSWVPFCKAMVEAASGHKQEALNLIRPIEATYPDLQVPRQWFALVYSQLGDEANTVKWLQRSADAREYMVLNLAVHPFYKNMEKSLGFISLKRRIGLEP